MTTATPGFEDALSSKFEPQLEKRQKIAKIFEIICLIGTLAGLVLLSVLMIRVFFQGLGRLNLQTITSFPSQLNPENAGFRASLLGSLWILVLTILFAVPLGAGAAIYLEEYAERNRFTNFLELNISNLAGVPSVLYGLLGLGLFVRQLRFITQGPTVLAGALTMSLVILPVIIVASREAIRSVPSSLREASYGVGATKWQTISNHVMPYAIPGTLTGMIIAVSRAVGDSASLLVVGGLVYVARNPGLFTRFTVLPLEIYFNISQPQEEFKELAAAGIVILLAVLLLLNSTAIYVRNRFEKRY